MAEKAEIQAMTSDELKKLITEQTEKILAKQGERKEWGVEEHVILLWRICLELGMPPEAKKDFGLVMQIAGLGGNASQFRQSAFLKDKLPKSMKADQRDILSKYGED